MCRFAIYPLIAWRRLAFVCLLWLQLGSATAVTLDKQAAYALVERLPEVRAWIHAIPRMTDGTSVGALMAVPERPILLAGWHYWSVNFYLDEGIHFHRWETFLVRIDGRRILVNDTVSGVISLVVWRRDKDPYAHIAAAAQPRHARKENKNR
jgi:hypothetical protein